MRARILCAIAGLFFSASGSALAHGGSTEDPRREPWDCFSSTPRSSESEAAGLIGESATWIFAAIAVAVAAKRATVSKPAELSPQAIDYAAAATVLAP